MSEQERRTIAALSAKLDACEKEIELIKADTERLNKLERISMDDTCDLTVWAGWIGQRSLREAIDAAEDQTKV